jgi:hypothetical protein
MSNQIRVVSVSEEKLAKDTRKFYSVEFQDATNMFAEKRSRNMWQQKNAAGENVWKIITPTEAKALIGKLIPGQIVTKSVMPYEIANESTGEVRTVNSYSSVVLGHEDVDATFAAFQHPVLGSAQANQLTPSAAFVEEAVVNPAILD